MNFLRKMDPSASFHLSNSFGIAVIHSTPVESTVLISTTVMSDSITLHLEICFNILNANLSYDIILIVLAITYNVITKKLF